MGKRYHHRDTAEQSLGWLTTPWLDGRRVDRQQQMTLTAQRSPQDDARTLPGDGARDAGDEALKALLRAWHDYEVLKALGAPLDTVSAAHSALQRARGEVARRRQRATC
jgi:hypothetical protein